MKALSIQGISLGALFEPEPRDLTTTVDLAIMKRKREEAVEAG